MIDKYSLEDTKSLPQRDGCWVVGCHGMYPL
jgi:hypothetical protein